jgi:hypothetical protein
LTSGYLSLLALMIFCLVAALMVYIYRPREPKEAFVLGLGVLAAVGMTVAPPKPTGLRADADAGSAPHAASEVPTTLSLEDILLGLLPSAQAQNTNVPDEPRRAGVWIFLDGPQQLRTPEAHVLIFGLQSKSALVNAPANAAFYIALPPGRYEFEISHMGYRSVAFSVAVESGTQALQVPMNQVDMELQNFFGPSRTKVKPRPEIARQLDSAQASCADAATDRTSAANAAANAAAASALVGLDKRWIKALPPEARRMLCA